MNNKKTTLWLLSHFCLLATTLTTKPVWTPEWLLSHFYPITTTPTTKPTYTPEQQTIQNEQNELDHYVKCLTMLVKVEHIDLHLNSKELSPSMTKETLTQQKAILTNKIAANSCQDEDFKHLFDYFKAQRAIRHATLKEEEHTQGVAQKAGISKEELLQKIRSYSKELDKELGYLN